MFAHLARDSRQYNMLAVIELNSEERVRLLVDNGAFRGNQIILWQ